MFHNANNIHISGGTFVVNNSNNEKRKHINLLLNQVARNAILNSGGRADDVRCHPGTRTELIRIIEEWIVEARKGDAPNIFWLSGPAGAGKTAIFQTIAERRRDQSLPQANFFFFRPDGSRNTANSFVPTLAYQLMNLYPVRDAVASTLVDDPLILHGSIKEQLTQLVASPIQRIRHDTFPESHPVVLIVDGLDECSPNLSQQQIISALGNLVATWESPFIVLLASRPHHNIETAIRALDLPVKSVFLDDTFSPAEDITRFVLDQFHQIKRTHCLAARLGPEWPSPHDIDKIVHNSSGQFIYAATVMRFIAHSPAAPSLSLKKVLGLARLGTVSPFASLDAFYTFILAQVDDWKATSDILAFYIMTEDLAGCVRTTVTLPHKNVLRFHAERLLFALTMFNDLYCEEVVVSCLHELSSILSCQTGDLVTFYHKSFIDFILDKTRSQQYWVDIDAFKVAFMNATWSSGDFNVRSVNLHIFFSITGVGATTAYELAHGPRPPFLHYVHFTFVERKIKELFATAPELYDAFISNESFS